MTIDEAIAHCLEVAEQNETQADKIGRQFIGSAMDKRYGLSRVCRRPSSTCRVADGLQRTEKFNRCSKAQ